MSHQGVVRKAVARRPPATFVTEALSNPRLPSASSDYLTMSGRLIGRGTQPEYPPARLATEDWPESQCEWLPFVQQQLEAIRSLAEGWDSYGAAAPNPSWLDGAQSLIACLSQAPGVPQPLVNPTRNGGVQFEWEAGDRYFELDVVAERAASYYWRDRSKAEQKEGTVFEGEPLDAVLECIWRVGA